MRRCLPACWPRRWALGLLLLPAGLYLLTPWLANRVQPVVLGLPFMVFYIGVVTMLAGAIMALVAWLDPVYRANAPEPVPADRPTDQKPNQP